MSALIWVLESLHSTTLQKTCGKDGTYLVLRKRALYHMKTRSAPDKKNSRLPPALVSGFCIDLVHLVVLPGQSR